MKTKTAVFTSAKRNYHMVESNGFVRGEIMLHPEQVRQFGISLECKLMRHLPPPKSYNLVDQTLEVAL